MIRRSWQGSTRKARLPSDWARLRERVLIRDGYRCQAIIDGQRHGVYGNQVDHIDRTGPDEEWNLQTLCRPCHDAKSSREGGLASSAARRARGWLRARPPEPHPGLCS
jgi:5-methylcytosine-specific restriction endonuclease McrA